MLFSEQMRWDCGVDRDQFDRLTLNRYLLIPNRLIFASSVGLGSPNLLAAPPGPETRPALSASAASIISFSCRCSALLSAAVGRANCGASRLSHVSSTQKMSPSLRITALSITFCNSRTLPGLQQFEGSPVNCSEFLSGLHRESSRPHAPRRHGEGGGWCDWNEGGRRA